jgi:glycosyltransferase involved in cell wall biosynthesis
MRIALCSSVVPFVRGGARNIVEWLETELKEAGHDVERVYLPHVDEPRLLFRQIAAFRWMDLGDSSDRLIAFRPPAHFVRHPLKVVWFIHHIRSFYDLWDTTYRGFPDDQRHRGIRDSLVAADTAALNEAKSIFTNSRVVSDRLLRFNGVESETLYPPIMDPERFRRGGFSDEVVCVCRVERHKRQHLLIEALAFTQTNVRLRLAGASSNPAYVDELHRRARELGLTARVTIDDRWISEDEKAEALRDCLASAYVALDEDSYGYPTLEAAHSSKATITTKDAGGVLEFVEDGVSGYVVDPDPEAIADAMDRLFTDRALARRLGDGARDRVDFLNINWRHVLERLLA